MSVSGLGGRGLLRAQVSNSWLYRLFNIFFGVLFFGIVVLTLFANKQTFFKFNMLWLLLVFAAGILAAWLLARLFMLLPNLSPGVEAIIVTILMGIFIALQVIVGWQLRVQPDIGWDYGIVYQSAVDYVNSGTLPELYFLHFPSGSGLYTLWVGLFSLLKMFGINDFIFSAFVLNIVCISVSIILLYLCGRHLFGSKKALFLLFTAFLTSPFLLYSPIACAETLALPFPIAVVLLWLKARNHWRKGMFGKTIMYMCILSAISALGGILKASVLIVWVAVALDLLILLCGKGRIRIALAGFAVAALVFVGGSWYARTSPMLPRYDYKDQGIPLSHWVMMGLQGDGGYSEADYQAILAGSDMSSRQSMIASEIQNRLAYMGPLGVMQHLGNKLSITYGEGTYGATDILSHSPQQSSAIHDFVIYTQPQFMYFAYFAFAVQAVMLLNMAVASFKSVWRGNNALTFLRIALFGLTLFLLLWETSSRYLITFLPLFLLCAAEVFPMPLSKKSRQDARRQLLEARDAKPLNETYDSSEQPLLPEDDNETGEQFDAQSPQSNHPDSIFVPPDGAPTTDSVWSYAGTDTLANFEERFLKVPSDSEQSEIPSEVQSETVQFTPQ